MKPFTDSLIARAAMLGALMAAPAAAQQDAAPEHGYEWGGIYELPEGLCELVIQPGPDASMDLALVPVADATDAAFTAAAAAADRAFAGAPVPVPPGGELAPGEQLFQLLLAAPVEMRFAVRAPAAGRYALFTQHFADEFQTVFLSGERKIHAAAERNFHERYGQIRILPAAQAAFGVQLEPAALHRLTPSFAAPARLAYDEERMAQVGAAVPGRVVDIPARLGDLVAAGAVLAVVESPALGAAQSDYLQKRTLAESSAPAVEVARDSYERARKLYEEQQSISLTEVQRRQADLLAAEAAVRNARAALSDAGNRLRLLGMTEAEIRELESSGVMASRHRILAPIAGRVIRRDLTLGEIVGPDREPLLVLADMSRLWLLADVPESRLQELTIGAAVSVELAAYPDRPCSGAVSFISPDVDEETRTAQLRVEVANEDGLLRPGMFARARITAGGEQAARAAPVLAVPDSAVQTIEGQPVVFVPLADHPGIFLKRPVTLGPPVGGMFPVLHGLREGEPVVMTGTFILKAELGKSSAKHEH